MIERNFVKKITGLSDLVMFAGWGIFLPFCYLVFFYFSWHHIQSLPWVLAATLVLCSATFVLSWLVSRAAFGGAKTSLELASKPAWKYLSAIIFGGLLLRVAYYLLVTPFPIYSDEIAYTTSVLRLLETGNYEVMYRGETYLRAYRPPGFPFLLTPLVAVFGVERTPVFVMNLGFYIATSIAVFFLARELACRRLGMISVLLLALWPGYIYNTGSIRSESAVIFLISLTMLAFFKVWNTKRPIYWMAIAGLSAGIAALFKPAYLLIPLLWVIYIIAAKRITLRSLPAFTAMLVVMLAVIAPWTARNYAVLSAFVPISTNSGLVFYSANNPEATGGYTSTMTRDLPAEYVKDEVQANRLGMQWGKEWILKHPFEFLRLVLSKQRILMGNDSAGAYLTLTRFVDATPPINPELKSLSGFAKVSSEVWWILIWMLCAVGLWRHRAFWLNSAGATTLLWAILYIVTVHSVFESQPRHHIPILGFLSLVAASGLLRKLQPQDDKQS